VAWAARCRPGPHSFELHGPESIVFEPRVSGSIVFESVACELIASEPTVFTASTRP